MQLYSPIDLTGNFIMIEKLKFGWNFNWGPPDIQSIKAASQWHKVDNQPLAFSLKAVVYPWEYWNKDLVTGCPVWRQPVRIRNKTLESENLFSSSWILPVYKIYLINL